MDNNDILDIVACAKEVFCDGIYVPSDMHPCGWDFISFENIEMEDDILDYKFSDSDVSNGNYAFCDFDECTLEEILEKTNGKYAFEIGQINW